MGEIADEHVDQIVSSQCEWCGEYFIDGHLPDCEADGPSDYEIYEEENPR